MAGTVGPLAFASPAAAVGLPGVRTVTDIAVAGNRVWVASLTFSRAGRALRFRVEGYDPSNGRLVAGPVRLPGAVYSLTPAQDTLFAEGRYRLDLHALALRVGRGAPSLDESALGFGALWGFDSVGDRIYALDPRRLVGRGRWFRVSRQRPEAIATGAGGVWLASIGPPATRRGRTVTARRTGTLVRIDPNARRITARVRLGVPGAVLPLKVAPNALAITGAEVWVGLSGLGRVLHVSTRAMAVVGAVDLGPGRLQLAAGAKLVWALNVDRATLTRIGPGRASQSWQVPLPPGIAAYPIRLALGAGGVWVLWESDGGKSGFCRFAPASRRWTPCR